MNLFKVERDLPISEENRELQVVTPGSVSTIVVVMIGAIIVREVVVVLE